MEGCREVSTPAVTHEPATGSDAELLPPQEATRYRAAAAKCNYLAQDRCDISFAAKETARQMSQPTVADDMRIKRLIRYLRHHPRGVYWFPWQGRHQPVFCTVDSDWAGCTRTRKSTSGGVLMRGRHCLSQWSRTQATVALSSGEAELNAALKGAAELLGLQVLLSELMHGGSASTENSSPQQAVVLGDSSACSGTLHREGSGRMKHLELRQLWLQEKVRAGHVEYRKISRTLNPADSLAKPWTTDGAQHFGMMGFHQLAASTGSPIQGTRDGTEGGCSPSAV